MYNSNFTILINLHFIILNNKMVKYALVIAFSYPKNINADYSLTKLSCTSYDIEMIYKICKKFNIDDTNITIITDLQQLSREIYNTNIKTNLYPDDLFVCREISQFIENTSRGIEENSFKGSSDLEYEQSEILLYISAHGSEIKINDNFEQGIVLTKNGGVSLRYLLSKDLFKIIFGGINISESGNMDIPVYKKIKKIIRVNNDTEKFSKMELIGELETINVKLQSPVNSPVNSPLNLIPYRSSYCSNRGISFQSKLLAIIDTCYSAHMTYFPFLYDPKNQIMIQSPQYNIDIHDDLPYCISISSCESDKTTNFTSSGSALTKILYNNFLRYNGDFLDILQLHYIIYSTENSLINNLLRSQRTRPIITSTVSNAETKIPFFCNIVKNKIRTIQK